MQDMSLDDIIKLNRQQQTKKAGRKPAAGGAGGKKRAPLMVNIKPGGKKVGTG